MREEKFIKLLKSYPYVFELLTEKHSDIPNWLYRQLKDYLK